MINTSDSLTSGGGCYGNKVSGPTIDDKSWTTYYWAYHRDTGEYRTYYHWTYYARNKGPYYTSKDLNSDKKYFHHVYVRSKKSAYEKDGAANDFYNKQYSLGAKETDVEAGFTSTTVVSSSWRYTLKTENSGSHNGSYHVVTYSSEVAGYKFNGYRYTFSTNCGHNDYDILNVADF